jgi:hypothetical protein
MRTSADFRKFIDIETKLSESVSQSPILVGEILDLPLNLRDFKLYLYKNDE